MTNEFGFDPNDLVVGEWYTLVHRDIKGKRIQTGFGYAAYVGRFKIIGRLKNKDKMEKYRDENGDFWFHNNHLYYSVEFKDIVGEGPPAEHYEVVITDD